MKKTAKLIMPILFLFVSLITYVHAKEILFPGKLTSGKTVWFKAEPGKKIFSIVETNEASYDVKCDDWCVKMGYKGGIYPFDAISSQGPGYGYICNEENLRNNLAKLGYSKDKIDNEIKNFVWDPKLPGVINRTPCCCKKLPCKDEGIKLDLEEEPCEKTWPACDGKCGDEIYECRQNKALCECSPKIPE